MSTEQLGGLEEKHDAQGASDKDSVQPPAFNVMLSEFRERSGLSKSDLARLMGLSPSTISIWENGKQRPPTNPTVWGAFQKHLNLNDEEMQQLAESTGRMPFNVRNEMLTLTWLVDGKERMRVHITPRIELSEDDFAMIVGQSRSVLDRYLRAREKSEMRLQQPDSTIKPPTEN